jgi:hypothetical protein
MSANDPKRTFLGSLLTPSRIYVRIGTMPCAEPRGGNETARFHQGNCGITDLIAAHGARTAVGDAGDRFP